MADLKIEQLGGGASTEENTGGIVNSEIYFAPTSWIDSLPDTDKEITEGPAADASEYVTISQDVVFKAGFAFTKFKAILEKNSFESNLIGGTTAKVYENKLTMNLVGSGPVLAGWGRRHKNDEFVVLFKTMGRGDYRMLGSNTHPATILDMKAIIGETREGDSMRTLVVGDKQLYEAAYYKGTRTIYPVS